VEVAALRHIIKAFPQWIHLHQAARNQGSGGGQWLYSIKKGAFLLKWKTPLLTRNVPIRKLK